MLNTGIAADCPGGGTASLAKPAEYPRVFLKTDPPAQTGRVLKVAADCANLQQQINEARSGDTVQIPAGTSCKGNYVLPRKPASSDWIVIRTSTSDDALPPGKRVLAKQSNLMPKLQTSNPAPALRTEIGAHHYRLIGLEIGLAPGFDSPINYGLLLLGDASSDQDTAEKMPTDLTVDRCYIHGEPTINVSRAVALNSGRTAIIDSYLGEIHAEGFDTQAIAGWNGLGPYKIVNNFLEAAGENLMFGGAPSSIPDLIPSDIEIKRNYFFKPLSWHQGTPGFSGKRWTIKNLFELKNAQRVLLEGNVFENNWIDAQSGFALQFTVRTEFLKMPWSEVQDVTVIRNLVRNSTAGINILGRDDNGNRLGRTRRILIKDNIFDQMSSEGAVALQMLESPQDITLDHNTFIYSGGRAAILFDGEPADRLVITNNILQHGLYGLFGSGKSIGKNTLSYYAPTSVISNNVLVAGAPFITLYPPSCNYFVEDNTSVGFGLGSTPLAEAATTSYELVAKSKFLNSASDRKAVGADIKSVTQASQSAMAGR